MKTHTYALTPTIPARPHKIINWKERISETLAVIGVLAVMWLTIIVL